MPISSWHGNGEGKQPVLVNAAGNLIPATVVFVRRLEKLCKAFGQDREESVVVGDGLRGYFHYSPVGFDSRLFFSKARAIRKARSN
ncbi:MAG: hypothetical protein C0507_00260 [Cyanobacteria bacterium PR.3.49]|nr:hypothetical protein [Cyanobacteria bacterium PR.3.49]